MTEHQVTLVLTPEQHKAIDRLLAERQKRDPMATRSDVMRTLLDVALHRVKK